MLRAVLLAAAVAVALAGSAPIVSFNNEAQQAVREYGIPSQISSKIYAYVHTAQYVAIDPKQSSDEQDAAAVYAGHTALSLFFPWRFARLDKALAPLLDGIPEKSRAKGEAAGRAAAISLIKKSIADGFASYAPFTPAPAGSAPGLYQFTPNQTNVVYPQIADTHALVLDNIKTYKPAPPLTIPSAGYTSALAETFRLGRSDSADRTAEQNDTAKFWADGNTTSTVAGHFNQIAQALLPASISTRKAAQLFAELNAATWDASIAAYRAKYLKPFWRPITAINQGDNVPADAAYVDAAWKPLLSTPAHPEHPSGHSATAAAAAAVITKRLGAKPFTIGTEFPSLAPRSYNNAQEAADEVNDSRVYAGVHFRHAVTEGAKLGAKVAADVLKQFEAKFKP
ncbi:hypothetical protein ABPG75_006729 [Micractinium tetrahymenae]